MRSLDDATPADALALYRRGMADTPREPRLRAVILDTLATPGGLIRLQLALLAGKQLELPTAIARSLATAIEYFHTASLLLDDLPCMDDATERRGEPTAHRQHGESAAILGALAFINRAYALLWQSCRGASPVAATAATAFAEKCLGASGILDGQSLDLQFGETDGTPRTAARAALGKTVSLLRLTLVTPGILADADPQETKLLDRLAIYWGLAYQITDDFSDLQPSTAAMKTPGRDVARPRPNFVLAAGQEVAGRRLGRLLHQLRSTMSTLVSLRPGWEALSPLINQLEAAAVAARTGDRELCCA